MPDGAAGQGTPTSGQFSRWGPAQRPAGPRAVHCRPPSRGAGMGPAALRSVSAIPMYGSRRTLGFPPRRNHLGTGGPSRRPPSAGCADRRSAQFSRWGLPCLRVAPPGGLGARRHVQRPRGAFCDSASAPEYEKSGLGIRTLRQTLPRHRLHEAPSHPGADHPGETAPEGLGVDHAGAAEREQDHPAFQRAHR